jgi:hypothetical protein
MNMMKIEPLVQTKEFQEAIENMLFDEGIVRIRKFIINANQKREISFDDVEFLFFYNIVCRARQSYGIKDFDWLIIKYAIYNQVDKKW